MAQRVIIAPGYWICKGPLLKDDHNGWLLIPRNKVWSWNENLQDPTFSPSIKAWHTRQNGEEYVNHFIITDGRVAFCGDCTHDLAGQTLDLLEWTEAEIACHSESGPMSSTAMGV